MALMRLDHIAMSCTDLSAAAQELENKLEVSLAPRGEHSHMGTHNRLLSLGPDIYFELIAIDPDVPGPDRPRWFNIDNFNGPPRLTNWIIATDDMSKSLSDAPDGMGVPTPLSRADFKWEMAIPDTGILPFDGWAPALIQWHGDAHPAQRLEDHGIRLQSLTLYHPEAEQMAQAFTPHLPRDTILFVPAEAAHMEARLSTSHGDVLLS